MKSEDEKLDRLLRTWDYRLPDDAGLERKVWQKIARREEQVSWLDDLTSWLHRPLLGPALAALLILAAVLAGVAAAEWRMGRPDVLASVAQSPEKAYFESINPVAHAQHLAHH